MDYYTPYIPSYNFNFNWQNCMQNFNCYNDYMTSFNYNMPSFNASSIPFMGYSAEASYPGKYVLSEEEREERIKRINEEIEKKKKLKNAEVDVTQLAEILDKEEIKGTRTETASDGSATTVASITEIDKALEAKSTELKNAKIKANGDAVIYSSMAEHKKKPWYEKAGRAIANMGQGVWKLATNFVGYEDGKWNWKKCLKNITIAAGAITLCAIPGVGPAISAGLIASGVIAGGVGVTKGIVKTTKAKTEEELDKAFQDIGAGAAIGITSALGLKGMGKAFRMTSATASESAATGIAGKISNLGRDMTVNAYRATVRNCQLSSSALRTEIATSSAKTEFGKNISGFLKSWGINISKALPIRTKNKYEQNQEVLEQNVDFKKKSIDDRLAKLGEENGGNQRVAQYIRKHCKNLKAKNPELYQKLQDKDITSDIIQEAQNYLNGMQKSNIRRFLIKKGTSTPQGQLLQQEQTLTELQLCEFREAQNITDLRGLRNQSITESQTKVAKEALTKLKAGEDVTLDGVRLSASKKSDIAALERSIERLTYLNKQVQQLVDTKFTMMRRMALRKKNKDIITTFNNGTEVGRLEAQRVLQLKEVSKIKYYLKAPFSLIWKAMAITFKPWEIISKTTAGSEYRLQQIIVPEYETFMLAKTKNKDEYQTLLSQITEIRKELATQKQTLEKEITALENEKKKLMYES